MTEKVEIVGLAETLSTLKQFDKSAVKKFNNVINTELTHAKNNAQALVPTLPPMSGWRVSAPLNQRKGKNISRGGAGWPAWNAAAVRAGISKTRAQGKVRGDYTTSAGALLNKNAAGAIFEIAGRSRRKSTVNDKGGAGNQFKRTLSNRFGKASRLIWKIVDRDGDRIRANVVRALEEAQRDLQKALDTKKS